jgi:hypothetical protein
MEHINQIHKNIIGNSNLFLQLLAYRMAGATIIFLWASVASCIMFGILKCTGKLRVSAKDEEQGKTLLITWLCKPTHSLLMFISTCTQKWACEVHFKICDPVLLCHNLLLWDLWYMKITNYEFWRMEMWLWPTLRHYFLQLHFYCIQYLSLAFLNFPK